jgi:hypothetical protein
MIDRPDEQVRGITSIRPRLDMARLWRQERAATVAAGADDRTVLPPEQHFPVPLIGVHGLLALTTLALVLLTAFGIGD